MTSESQCELCHIGVLQQRRATYVARLGSHLLALPGIRVTVCDVCGEVIYDPEVILHVQMLLGVDLGSLPPTRRPGAPNEPSAEPARLASRRKST